MMLKWDLKKLFGATVWPHLPYAAVNSSAQHEIQQNQKLQLPKNMKSVVHGADRVL